MYVKNLRKGTHFKNYEKSMAEEALTKGQTFPFHFTMNNF